MREDLPVRAAWLFVVVLFSLGAAGLVTEMNHRPGSDSRSELTWRADQLIKPALDAATLELDGLARDFEALGGQGRLAIAALTTGDAAQLQSAMATGQEIVDRIAAAAAGLRSRIRTLPGFGPVQDRYFSGPTIERWNRINAALDTTNGIGAVWLALTTGGTDALELMTLLQSHDELVAGAAKVGAEGDYPEAVHQLDLAAPVFRDLRALQDQLANRLDVSLLAELLDRTERLDETLRTLYSLLVTTDGQITEAVTAALADVQAARDQMPADTRALSVILAEIGQAGPNDAVIRIELARGRLLDAIGALGEELPEDGGDAGATDPAPDDTGSPDDEPPGDAADDTGASPDPS